MHITTGKPKKTRGRLRTIELPCACANLRRATRLATQLYESELRPSGLLPTQFTLLQALKLAPGSSQKQLGELLGIDSTTLTRTLVLLRRKGWMRSEAASDRRELRLFLTTEGQQEYQRAIPYWESAQKRLRKALGADQWNRVLRMTVRIAEAIPQINQNVSS